MAFYEGEAHFILEPLASVTGVNHEDCLSYL
jgi:hypothetical protein